MISDSSLEKKNYFSPFFFFSSFYKRNQKPASRLNKSVISNADRKSLEREKQKRNRKTIRS